MEPDFPSWVGVSWGDPPPNKSPYTGPSHRPSASAETARMEAGNPVPRARGEELDPQAHPWGGLGTQRSEIHEAGVSHPSLRRARAGELRGAEVPGAAAPGARARPAAGSQKSRAPGSQSQSS